MFKRGIKRGDLLLVLLLAAGLAAFAVARLAGGDAAAGLSAVIEVDGQPYMTVDLADEGREIEIHSERGYNLLRIRDGGIEMLEADCPDQLCKGFGHVHRPRGTIVCLPNRVFVEVIGGPGEGAEPDAIVQ